MQRAEMLRVPRAILILTGVGPRGLDVPAPYLNVQS
jgi:hypothetical protein